MFRGFNIYRDVMFRQTAAGVLPPPSVLSGLPEEYGYRIEFFNPATGDIIGLLGSDIKNNPVMNVEFTMEEFGPGEFKMELSTWPVFDIAYRTGIRIRPFFDQGKPWFTGFIKKVPVERVPGDPLVYEGYGYYDQLSWVLVNGKWTGIDTGALWGQVLLNSIVPNTDIKYSGLKIGNTGYNQQDLTWDYAPGADVGDDLAKISGNFVFGVDQDMDGFFKAIITTPKNHWWEGVHFANVELDLDPDKIINRVYVKGGEVDPVTKSNIISIREDSVSIGTYGLREKTVSLPSCMDVVDGNKFGDYQLALYKDPRQTGKVSGLNLNKLSTQRPVVVNGHARVTMANEDKEYSIQVRRVNYTISSEGIYADVELGDLDAPIEGPFLELIRKIEQESRINDRRATQFTI